MGGACGTNAHLSQWSMFLITQGKKSMKNEKVHFDDVEVVWREDIKGWVGPDGLYYGTGDRSEFIARLSNCDLVTCNSVGCKNHINARGMSSCQSCRDKKEADMWSRAERRNVGPDDEMFYSEKLGEYFYGIEEVGDYIKDHNIRAESLLLYHCKRENPPQVDLTDVYESLIPEGLDIDDMVTEEINLAAEKLNELMLNHPVNCWVPTRVAAEWSGPALKGSDL